MTRNIRLSHLSRHAMIAAGIAVILGGASRAVAADPIKVFVDGDRVRFEDVGPQQMSGRILVPVRGVLEKMGAQVEWAPENQRVNASNGDIDIVLHIGDKTARVNGHDVEMDVPAQTIGGHTMVPLRFLSEALGAKVNWDASENTVFIMTPDAGKHTGRRHRPDGDPQRAPAQREERRGNDNSPAEPPLRVR